MTSVLAAYSSTQLNKELDLVPLICDTIKKSIMWNQSNGEPNLEYCMHWYTLLYGGSHKEHIRCDWHSHTDHNNEHA